MVELFPAYIWNEKQSSARYWTILHLNAESNHISDVNEVLIWQTVHQFTDKLYNFQQENEWWVGAFLQYPPNGLS